ncbi:uncharacterized protein LOC133872077 isoform X2 [Alnus glutinosa]|uniref:uncharacterized protein LOC133872077 isoform X2 n=1 Tax=Alnus glutinosa TaxID=3517 RepID=UPI002D77C71B|nr:uncharacterized protein LOC133872077 isoform X2 [Alnus glutinosa]
MPLEDSKPVKKSELEDEEEADEKQSLGSILEGRKKKPSNANAGSAKTRLKEPKVKKEERLDDEDDKPIKASLSSGSRSKVKKEENEDDDDEKPLAKRSSNIKPDKEPKRRNKTKEEEKADTAAERKKREKKVYDLPGQKRDPPDERDSLRIFYETLYKHNPDSEMAQFWMMESGLLSKEVAKKVYEKKQKGSTQQKFSSPAKAVATVKRTTVSVSVKKKLPCSPVSSNKKRTTGSIVASRQTKKQKIEDGSSDDDIVLANKKRPSPLASSNKKKVTDSKVLSNQSKKRKKIDDGSSEDDSDDDFEPKAMTKRQRAA